jgi:hypothetical protein
VYECRFGFGRKQRYDPSGQSKLTLGMEPVFQAEIYMDGNQQEKFFLNETTLVSFSSLWPHFTGDIMLISNEF